MALAYIALGSNLQGPEAQIRAALDALDALPGSALLRCSSLYRSQAIGPAGQPDYINAVALLETRLAPRPLLQALQRRERQQGRRDGPAWGPRTLDLDILLYDTLSVQEDGLRIPHPELAVRNFVLLPLQEIAPELHVPGLGALRELLAVCPPNPIERLERSGKTGAGAACGAMSAAPTLGVRARFIAVEGPIGAGKTTLARRLADTLGHALLLEDTGDNPFLDRFYRERRAMALPTQLFFLLQRVRQLDALRQPDLFHSGRIADFLFHKDQLFARLNLSGDEYALYQQIHERLGAAAPAPDLVIYLQARPAVLLQRVRRRGADFERGLERAYLEQVCAAYVEFFHHYQEAPLLIVNTDNFDLAAGRSEYQLLLEHIRGHRSGRRYLNPRSFPLSAPLSDMEQAQ